MAKITVEECLVLDVLVFAQKGWLREGASSRLVWRHEEQEVACVIFHVKEECLYLPFLRWGEMTNSHHYPVELERTHTSFGAERVWFQCPVCGRRVRKLYLPPGERRFHFLCRSCHGLTYRSRQRRARLWEQEQGQADKLGRLLERPNGGRRAERQAIKEYQRLQAIREEMRLRVQCWLSEEDGLEQDSLATMATRLVFGLPPKHPAKRPRGRPKVKRAYQRQKPFLLGERHSESEILCLKCRDFREPRDPVPVTLPNGRPALKGTCPVCGATVCQIVKKGGARLPPSGGRQSPRTRPAR